MSYQFDGVSPVEGEKMRPQVQAQEPFRIPRKSIGPYKSETSTKEWPVKSDENGVSPINSPGPGPFARLDTNGLYTDFTASQPPHHNRFLQFQFLRWWRIEFIAVFITLASLAGQIVALAYVDGKPQDAWGSDVLTLNGFIAILSTTHRMSLMVVMGAAIAQTGWIRLSRRDGQGRCYPLKEFVTLRETANGSTLSSLKALWLFKGGHIACLGALLVLTTLGIDAFYQQLIDLRIVLVPDTSSKAPVLNVERAHWVDSVHGFSNSWEPSRATKLAMHNGFIAPKIDAPNAICPTGNCTWPIVPTVGVCGTCVNLTDEIAIANRTAPVCTVSYPGGLEVKGQCQGEGAGAIFNFGAGSGRAVSNDSSSLDVVKRKGRPDLEVPTSDAVNFIIQFGAVGVPGSKLPGAVLVESMAAECAIWYCLQAHNVSVIGGRLSDNVVETWSKASTKQDVNAGIGQNVTFIDIPKSMNVEDDVEYGLGYMQTYAMRDYTNKTFTGNASSEALLSVVSATTDFAEGLLQSFDEIDDWMDRLTLSLTNEIRVNQGREGPIKQEPEKRYASTVLINQVTTVVRWPWLSFPAAITAISIIYMFIEMVRTTHSDAQAWKQDEYMPLCLAMDDTQLLGEVREGQYEPDGLKKRIENFRVGMKRRAGDGGPLVLGRSE